MNQLKNSIDTKVKDDSFYDLFDDHMAYFNKLTAMPLNMLVTQNDEMQLYKIATSSMMNKKKFVMIDEVMTKYPYFRRMGAGTNRLIYMNLLCPDHVVKVGFDRTALNDGFNELRAQELTKPFNTKIFEASPMGVFTSSEVVTPINNLKVLRKEIQFILNVIKTLIYKRNLMFDDLGISYYKNWGLRANFYPVMLDFPYVYKIRDPYKQLKCLTYTPEGEFCDGILDYDISYNNLECIVCGKKHSAKTLSERVDESFYALKDNAKNFKNTLITEETVDNNTIMVKTNSGIHTVGNDCKEYPTIQSINTGNNLNIYELGGKRNESRN